MVKKILLSDVEMELVSELLEEEQRLIHDVIRHDDCPDAWELQKRLKVAAGIAERLQLTQNAVEPADEHPRWSRSVN